MIPDNINKEDIIKAIDYIDKNGVPKERESKTYNLIIANKKYPPKYIISIANKYANGEEHNPSLFSGGDETNNFLRKLGFNIINENEGDIVYPIEASSWTIYSPSVFVKEMDRSSFIHHGSGVPKEIRQFFGVGNLKKGQVQNIILIHNNITYNARIGLDNIDSPRTRLFWKADFANLIKCQLPDWYMYYQNKMETPEEPPQLRFKKNTVNDNTYFVDFINPTDISLDIEGEISEEEEPLLEGAVKHYYGKKYERKPENRKRAIEIHGLKCAVCGFDFEKVYGERGKGFIEIHHTKPLSLLGNEQIVDPGTDLIPVCSNCHKMIHRRKDHVLSIEEIKKIIKTS